VDGVELTSGSHLPADVVVEAVGGLPNTEWLDAGFGNVSSGVLTGNDLLVEGHPEVAACGDVVRFPNPLFPGGAAPSGALDDGHRDGPTGGALAGPGLGEAVGPGRARRAHRAVPTAALLLERAARLHVQGLGMIDAAEQTVQLERGAAGEAAFGHLRSGRLVGVTLLGLGSRLAVHREQLEVALGLR
jgi:NADPH-dependent 2,4-dienoyl-CoA reductase/sulfur reductase-like enzyme